MTECGDRATCRQLDHDEWLRDRTARVARGTGLSAVSSHYASEMGSVRGAVLGPRAADGGETGESNSENGDRQRFRRRIEDRPHRGQLQSSAAALHQVDVVGDGEGTYEN